MARNSSSEPVEPGDTPAPESAEQPSSEQPTSPTPIVAPPSLPVLERVRRNRMGALAAGLLVAILVGLLLSVLVPSSGNLLAYSLLGLLLTAAVAATVRYLSVERGWEAAATAAVCTAIGVHLMLVTGAVNSAGSGLLEQLGVSGPGFDDALLASLATPIVSSGALVCALIAAIVAGWGTRAEESERRSRPAGY